MRELSLTGAPNARDLGGLPTMHGYVVRRGQLFRSGALGRLTDEDVAVLAARGLRTVVDLRHVSEIALAPPDRLPDPPPAVERIPIYDPNHPVFTYVSAVLLGQDGPAYGALAEEGTAGAMAAIYRWFVNGEAARAAFGAAVRLFAEGMRLPALLHCSAGKDRAGWLSVIVLSALDVDRATIEADYLASNEASAKVNQAVLRSIRERRPDLNEELIWPVFQARRAYLHAAYAEVERLYGTFDEYLRTGLGLSDATLDALREQLLDVPERKA